MAQKCQDDPLGMSPLRQIGALMLRDGTANFPCSVHKMLYFNGLWMCGGCWHGMCQREEGKVAIRDHQTVDTDRGF